MVRDILDSDSLTSSYYKSKYQQLQLQRKKMFDECLRANKAENSNDEQVIQAINKHLQEKENELEEKKDEIERGAQISFQKEEQMKIEKEQEVQKYRIQLQDKEKEVAEKEQEIQRYHHQLLANGGKEARQEQGYQEEREVAEQEQEILRYKCLLQEKEKEEAEKDQEIQRYQDQLAQKEEEEAEREQEILKYQYQLQEKEREETEKDQEILQYCNQLIEKEGEAAEREQEILRYKCQLQKKEREEAEKDQEIQKYQDQLAQKEEGEAEREQEILKYQYQLQEKEREEAEKDQEILQYCNQLLGKEGEVAEREQEILRYQRHLQVKESEAAEKDQEIQRYQHQLVAKERELHQSQEAVRIYQQQLLTDDHWVIDKNEVTLTKEELGKGSYANVEVGIFRGLRVAVKSLHTIIVSDYNLALFSREMSIASRVRHPNLVQFIGATKVGNPLILTELMSTNLHKELQMSHLSKQQIVSIAKDVALGLNYLHLFKPQPIIHRDISSPNILLKPCIGSAGYEAKVADYGTAKLQQGTSTGTVMPGNPAYAAPEAPIPDQHSPAMDVYSYSVLLMEMILRSPPEMTTVEREAQVSLISWSTMRSIIQNGLNSAPRARPTMAHILVLL